MATLLERPPAAVAAARPDGLHPAGPADDAGIRALLRETVTPGAVAVAFTREPAWAAGAGLAGSEDHTLVVRERGEVVALGQLAMHEWLHNGAPARIGYLGALRLRPGRAAGVRRLRAGYALLGARAAGTVACVTSIAADNARARRVLEHGRALGLPPYEPLADLATPLVPVRPRDARGEPPPVATAPDVDALTAFLAAGARDGQLALPWTRATWDRLATHGFTPADVVVLHERGTIVAAAGVWDQRRFRQVTVAGYGGLLRWGRPFAQAAARLGLVPPLPPPGGVVAQGAVVAPTVADARWWPPLWRAVRAHAARRGLSWLTVTCDVADPRWPALHRAAGGRVYRTCLYEVRWPSLGAPAWDGRPFRPEVALL